jgi:parallel beta-helix repeat protein
LQVQEGKATLSGGGEATRSERRILLTVAIAVPLVIFFSTVKTSHEATAVEVTSTVTHSTSGLAEDLSGADYGDPHKPACEASLQSLVDAAAPESVVVAPGGCVYRETVVVGKPLTLVADPGAEIRGSEIWTGWEKRGDHWVKGVVPPFFAGDGVKCTPGTERCLWPEQVFLDGKPLMQVDSNPQSGQFSVDSERNVVLADDPDGHVVEVSVRRQWVAARADNVTIRGFTMRHAANARGLGAITNRHDGGLNYHSGWTIEDNVLSDAHAAVVALKGEDNKLLGNDISRGGQLGIHGGGQHILVQNNRIHDNNTEDFHRGWEAGGAKFAVGVNDLRVDDNEIFSNRGGGFWCDVDCTEVIYSNNRAHHNWGAGLHLEGSSGAKIFGNVVWENGWRYHTDSRVWAAGIKVSCSRNVEIYDNVLAWNASGITVLHYEREDPSWNVVEDIYVHNNSILSEDGPSLYWVQADGWEGGMMARRSANNRGERNRYWYLSSQYPDSRFRWVERRFGKLTRFSRTRGEERGRYISQSEKEQIVSSAGIPSSPEPH